MTPEKQLELAKAGVILSWETGSRMYGLQTEESDHDRIHVFVPSKSELIGSRHVETIVDKSEHDATYHSLPKYVSLLCKANPHAIETLFANPLFMDGTGAGLVKYKNLFLTQKIRYSFHGYAISQAEKLMTREDRKHRFPYDTKFAAHYIRTLREGIDLLTEGYLTYPLPYKDLLLSIKNGEYDAEFITEYAQKLIEVLTTTKSCLAESLMIQDEILDLQTDLIYKYWATDSRL